MKMSKKRKKRFGSVLMILGLILFFAASSLTAYNIWDEKRADDVVTQVLKELDALDELDSIEAEETLDSETNMPMRTIDNGTFIGFLKIPTLGLRLPVMQEWDYPNLRISPCRYSGSVYTNDMVVAAHNYSSHFGTLDRLQSGDDIWFIDMNGNRFHYTVTQTESIMPTQIEHMITGDWDLTLFTCNYSGRVRVTVRCDLKS